MPTITEAELDRLESLSQAHELPQVVGDLVEALREIDDERRMVALDASVARVIASQSRSALIAWQFQAAGAALALQRLMSAAQKMREAQQAWEYIINSATQEAASNVVDAEDAFDDMLAGLLADMQGVEGNNDRP